MCNPTCDLWLQAKKAGDLGDTEQLRLAAEDAEFTRAKERLTLKHRNTSKWARRALKRGINITDEGAHSRSNAPSVSCHERCMGSNNVGRTVS
jgi:hypothetical protein